MAYPLQPNQQQYFDVGGVRYTWDPATGQYRAPNGAAYGTTEGPGGPTIPDWQSAGNQAPPGTPGGGPILSPAPNAPGWTAPAPAPDWRTQQGWWGSLFPTGVTQRAAYDLDPSFAWATATNKLGGNSWAPEYGWMAAQQGRYHTLYGDENVRAQGTPQGAETFADWIEANAPRFHQEYLNQPSAQKGYNLMYQPAGRWGG